MENDHPDRDAQPITSETFAEAAGSRAPRLRISHLLLWTFCSAAYLTMLRHWMTNEEIPDEYDSARLVTGLIMGIVNGGTLTGAISLMSPGIRGGSLRLKEPGYWLVIAHAVHSFFLWVPLWILSLTGDDGSEVALAISSVVLFAAAVIYLLATFKYSQLRWKLFFAALAVLNLVKSSAHLMLLSDLYGFGTFGWMLNAYSLGDLLLCLWILVLAAIDKTSRKQRDWLHWVGVVAFVVTQCQNLIWAFFAALL